MTELYVYLYIDQNVITTPIFFFLRAYFSAFTGKHIVGVGIFVCEKKIFPQKLPIHSTLQIEVHNN